MDNYFRLLYHSSLILLPVSLLLFLLLKYDLLKKGDPAKDKYLSFTKKLIILSFFGGIATYFITNGGKVSDAEHQNRYIDQCVSDVRIDFLSESQKDSFCQCAHDYLYKKYGRGIYDSKAELDFEDKKEMVVYFLKVKAPNMHDSLIVRIRKAIKTENDIPAILNEIKSIK